MSTTHRDQPNNRCFQFLHFSFGGQEHRWTLILLLETFRHIESTLSRDRLFALLGFSSDGNDAVSEPDYKSAFEDIVLKFACAFVGQGRGLQLLYRAGISSKPDHFPSWIPDWTKPRPPGIHDSSDCGVLYAASNNLNPEFRCISDTRELVTKGHNVDVIISVSKSCNIEREWKRYFKEVDTMVDSLQSIPSGDTRKNMKWKVLVAGALYPKVTSPKNLDFQPSYNALQTSIIKDEYKNRSKSSRVKRINYVTLLEGTVHGWRFVTTERGFVGVVPRIAQVGDIVTIINGARVPFLTRKSKTITGAYLHVGECYIHGITNGGGLSLEGVVEKEIRFT
jgi:hypothetical protein